MADSGHSDSAHGTSDEYIDPWCDPCENDGMQTRAVSYCSICVDFFCKQSDESHSSFQITKHHNKVERGTDMPSCQAAKPPKYEECGLHSGELKEYFCIVHSTLICRKCQHDHTKCFVEHATEMSKILTQTDVISLESEVTDAQKDISDAKYAIECNILSVQRKRKSMLKAAEKEHDKLKTVIKAKLNSVTKEINNKCDEEISSLTILMNDFSDGIAEYDSALNMIQMETRSKLDTKSFIKLHSLVDHIRLINTSLHETTEALKATDLDLEVDLRWKSLLYSCPEIGTVHANMSTFSPTVQLREMDFPPINTEPFRDITETAYALNSAMVFGAFSVGNQFSSYYYTFHPKNQDSDIYLLGVQWTNSDGFWKEKIPMTVLIAPNKETLVAFGYEAEKKYKELNQYGKHIDYFYFPILQRN